jgi:hypothetical protein
MDLLDAFQVKDKRKYTEEIYANKQMLKEARDLGLLGPSRQQKIAHLRDFRCCYSVTG